MSVKGQLVSRPTGIASRSNSHTYAVTGFEQGQSAAHITLISMTKSKTVFHELKCLQAVGTY